LEANRAAAAEAWRIYLGLPMTGSRLPPGGMAELARRASEDAVLALHGPITAQAAAEFDGAFAQLRKQLDLGDGPVGLLGGSIGATVAQLVLTDSSIPAKAAVLVNPMVQLRPVVDALPRHFGVTYTWSPPSLAVAGRLDFVARAEEIAGRGEPAVLAIVGEQDDPDAFHMPAQLLCTALASRYADPERVRLHVVPGMAHALAAEAGVEPAPQTPDAATVDQLASAWLRQHLNP
jgi:pimeloyl-ACP methyl ester carboxylesterase